MTTAAGVWLLVLGYALVYTGASWFANSSTAPTLSDALGLSGVGLTGQTAAAPGAVAATAYAAPVASAVTATVLA